MIDATILSRDLAAAMKRSVAAHKAMAPHLAHAHVAVADDALQITTTDLSCHCTLTIPAQVESEGAAVVDAGKLAAVAGLGETIILRDVGGALTCTARPGRNRARLATTAAPDEFPLPDDEAWESIDVDAAAVRDAIRFVAYAAPKNDVRTYLNAVCLRRGRAIASDGKLLAAAPLDYSGADIILPVRMLPQIEFALDAADATLQVATDKRGTPRLLRVARSVGALALELNVLLLAGQFPAVDAFLAEADKPGLWSGEIQRGDLRAAVDSARHLVPASSGLQVAAMVAGGDGVCLRCDGEDQCTFWLTDKPHEAMQFNARLDSLADMLASGDTPTIRVTRIDNSAAGSIALSSDDGTVHLLAGCVA